jgi:hypothetical protein
MAKFLEDAQNPEFQSVLEQAFREISSTTADSNAANGGENVASLLGSLKTKSDIPADVDLGVAKTLQVRECIIGYNIAAPCVIC